MKDPLDWCINYTERSFTSAVSLLLQKHVKLFTTITLHWYHQRLPHSVMFLTCHKKSTCGKSQTCMFVRIAGSLIPTYFFVPSLVPSIPSHQAEQAVCTSLSLRNSSYLIFLTVLNNRDFFDYSHLHVSNYYLQIQLLGILIVFHMDYIYLNGNFQYSKKQMSTRDIWIHPFVHIYQKTWLKSTT